MQSSFILRTTGFARSPTQAGRVPPQKGGRVGSDAEPHAATLHRLMVPRVGDRLRRSCLLPCAMHLRLRRSANSKSMAATGTIRRRLQSSRASRISWRSAKNMSARPANPVVSSRDRRPQRLDPAVSTAGFCLARNPWGACPPSPCLHPEFATANSDALRDCRGNSENGDNSDGKGVVTPIMQTGEPERR